MIVNSYDEFKHIIEIDNFFVDRGIFSGEPVRDWLNEFIGVDNWKFTSSNENGRSISIFRFRTEEHRALFKLRYL